MATNENINVKVTLDTSQFDSSLDGMKQEFRELEKQLGSSLLSEEDKQAVLIRMGDLKHGIDDLNMEINNLDAGNVFGDIVTLAGPLVGAFTAAGSAAQLLGIENEKVNEVIQKTTSLTIGLASLQQVADSTKLKSLLKYRTQQVKSFIVDKLTFANTKKQAAANVVEAATKSKASFVTKAATKAQWLWNAAITANPLILIIAAIAALAAGVYLLTKAFGDNTEELTDNEKAIDGVYIRNEELRESYNESVRELKLLNLEYQNITGTLSDYEYALALLNLEKEKSLAMSDEEFAKAETKILEDSITIWDKMLVGFKFFMTKKVEVFSDAALKHIKNEKETNTDLIDLTKEHQKKREKIEKDYKNKKLKLDKEQADEETEIVKSQYRDISDAIINSLLRIKGLKFSLLPDNLESDLKKLHVDTQLALDILYVELLRRKAQYNENAKKIEKSVDEEEKRILINQNQNLLILIKTYEEEVILLKANAGLKINQLEKKWDKKTYDDMKKFHKSLLDLEKNYRDQQLTLIELSEEEIQRTVDLKRIGSLKSSRDYEGQLLNEKLDATRDYYKVLKDIAEEEGDFEGIKILDKQMNLELDDMITSFGERWDTIKQNLVDSIADMTGIIAGGISQVFERDIANNFENLNKRIADQYDQQSASLAYKLEKDMITQEQYDDAMIKLNEEQAKKELDLKIRQAKAEKKLAMFQIIVDTAIGVAKSWGQGGGILGAPLAAIVAAQGAIQLGIAASTPLPEFEEGGQIMGPSHSNGGVPILAEGKEYIINNDVAQSPGMNQLLNEINNSGGNDESFIKTIIQETINGFSSIPVVQIETDVTKVQRKVKTIQDRSRW